MTQLMAQADFRRSRVSLEGEAVIRDPNGDWRAPLGDVSITGLNLPRPPGFNLRVGQALEVELHCGPGQEGIDLFLLARVARIDATTVGVRFAPMPDRLARAFEQVLARHGTLRGGAREPVVGN
ncbi:PilZ domain-containing protein [Lysobacter sp. KIS68-7]|uniref:PilZ domain-containing protein n=1 Tax=Lysobacter sp. KIS68-7 TaxID=2904252 RepID=UPI001E2C6B76|nr:PilZ domain-containing protein [Lysobacter sp. KIS68-7]UHQ18971.1 PilZ domain-containing protein [Lysobacter sp. KIS68-7]